MGNTGTIQIQPKKRDERKSGTRGWCGTYQIGDVEAEHWSTDLVIQKMVCSDSLGIVQLEHGKDQAEGVYHCQLYIEFKKRKRLSFVKNMFGNKIHWEPRFGSLKEAVTYCLKNDPEEGGRVDGTNFLSWGGCRIIWPPKRRELVRYELESLYGWQSYVFQTERLGELCPPKSRTVIYVYSSHGAIGKSTFACTMADRHDQNVRALHWKAVASS